MNEAMIVQLGREALLMTVTLSGPALGCALVVGLFISVIQAATQINEVTLSFVPKILAVFLALAVLGPWMMSRLMSYTTWLLGNMATWAR